MNYIYLSYEVAQVQGYPFSSLFPVPTIQTSYPTDLSPTAGCDYCPNLFFLHLLQTAYFLSLLIKQELWGTSEAVFVACGSILTGMPVYVPIKPLVFSVWDHLQEQRHVDVQLARVKFFSVWTYQPFIYTTLRLFCLLSCCLQGLLGCLWREAESPPFIGMIYSATRACPNPQIFIESDFSSLEH